MLAANGLELERDAFQSTVRIPWQSGPCLPKAFVDASTNTNQLIPTATKLLIIIPTETKLFMHLKVHIARKRMHDEI